MNAHCFLDGGYLRGISKQNSRPLVDPRNLASNIVYSELVQFWRTPQGMMSPKEFPGIARTSIGLARVLFYDACSDEVVDPEMEEYWRAIEILPDTEARFGVLRGRRRRQKGVDGLVAVDMLVGAFNGLFQVAILVAGDGDFVPIVEAVRRRGVMVVVAAEERSLSEDLRRAADRIWTIDTSGIRLADFPPLRRSDGHVWLITPDGKVRISPEAA
jgi:uncharacterized LabA/DUF88 family protein